MIEDATFLRALSEHLVFHDLRNTVVQVNSGVPSPAVLVAGVEDVSVFVRWMRTVSAVEARVGVFTLEAHGRLSAGLPVVVRACVRGVGSREFGPEGSVWGVRELAGWAA